MAEKRLKVKRYSLWKAGDGRIMMVDWFSTESPGLHWASLIVLNPSPRGKRHSYMRAENFGTFLQPYTLKP